MINHKKNKMHHNKLQMNKTQFRKVKTLTQTSHNIHSK